MEQPPIGWTTHAQLEAQKDGDTIVVSISRFFVLRLIDDEIYFDTPETYRPKSEEERVRGEAAKTRLWELLTKEVEVVEDVFEPIDSVQKLYRKISKKIVKRVPREIIIRIPASPDGRMDKTTQFGRFHAQIWADGVDVIDKMIEEGHIKDK